MTLLLFLKPAYTPPSFGGRVLGDTENARKSRLRDKREKDEKKKERIRLRKEYKRLKKRKVPEEAAVEFVPEIPPFQSIPFNLRDYAEDLMRASVLRMQRIRDMWLLIRIMLEEEDD